MRDFTFDKLLPVNFRKHSIKYFLLILPFYKTYKKSKSGAGTNDQVIREFFTWYSYKDTMDFS